MAGKSKTQKLKQGNVFHDVSLFTDYDIHLFKEGNHFKLYKKLGSHILTVDNLQGTYFALWAPNAQEVSVIGNFNGWNPGSHKLEARWDGSGIFEGFIPGIGQGEIYKYHIVSKFNNYRVEKGDPFAFFCEVPPKTASVVWDLNYKWDDRAWIKDRKTPNSLDQPVSIYEVHLGSWRRVPDEWNRSLSYREMARHLVDYVKSMGFTHVEFLPVMEHPFFGSWGYQILGFFAPTSRYGTPQDFMYLVDTLHQNGIGVILDWVPSHFPNDEHGLVYFDGTHLYEHADPRKGFHPDWKSCIFNHGRCEVKNFLISSSLFWLERYHIDGLRVDAVASMLYLDYSRRDGDWIPNEYGGNEDIDAINFLKRFNEVCYQNYPDIQNIAEESTSWPMVSRPTYAGGLGFGLKWNMGWMHDVLEYFSKDPIHRKYHQHNLTFGLWYAFYENFVLVLSHDEVVHGKGSLINKMSGLDWEKHSNLKLLYGYMYGHPGKKLLFMGAELAQWKEWEHDQSLDWHLLQFPFHQSIQRWVRDLNRLYNNEPALFGQDFTNSGFEWIDYNDWQHSVVSFIRRSKSTDDIILVVCNFTPVARHDYRIGVPKPGFWKEVLNSDAGDYEGSGQGNLGGVNADNNEAHGRPYSLSLTLPASSILFFKNK